MATQENEAEQKKKDLERKQGDLRRLKQNLSDEAKNARRERAEVACLEEEKSITNQIARLEKLIAESTDG